MRRTAKPGWEHSLMRLLAYPANLMFAGLAAFVLAIPLVTALPAAVAAARSMDGWLRNDSNTVFTSTFREFGATWRRTLLPGVVTVVLVAILVVDGLFLWSQVNQGTSGLGLAAGAASVPVAVAVALLLLAFPVAASRNRDGTTKQWLIEAAYLIISRPLRAATLLVLSIAIVFTCVLLPTIIPFFGISVPVYLALVSLSATTAASSRA